MNYFNNLFKEKKINKKRLFICIFALILIISLVVIFSLYVSNINFRNYIDIYILRKNITDQESLTIDLSNNESTNIFAYDKYIAVLNKNSFKGYSNSAKSSFELELNLSNPISCSNNRFICIAEKGGQKIYLISGQNIVWQNDLEGEISNVSVNKNGYVSVTIIGTSYKSIVITFDSNGKELFRTYLSSTMAVSLDISNDNKYLALAEIDYTGTSIQSNIKIVSLEKAQSDPTNAIDYIYPATSGSIIISIKFQDKNKLVCMYNDSIHTIQNNNDSEFLKIDNKLDTFCDINLKNTVLKLYEKSSGLSSESSTQLYNINSDKVSLYQLSSATKSIFSYNDLIALNFGTEIHFINLSGWLVKKYYSSQEITNIVLGNSIAGIIYKNKIEIVNF